MSYGKTLVLDMFRRATNDYYQVYTSKWCYHTYKTLLKGKSAVMLDVKHSVIVMEEVLRSFTLVKVPIQPCENTPNNVIYRIGYYVFL